MLQLFAPLMAAGQGPQLAVANITAASAMSYTRNDFNWTDPGYAIPNATEGLAVAVVQAEGRTLSSAAINGVAATQLANISTTLNSGELWMYSGKFTGNVADIELNLEWTDTDFASIQMFAITGLRSKTVVDTATVSGTSFANRTVNLAVANNRSIVLAGAYSSSAGGDQGSTFTDGIDQGQDTSELDSGQAVGVAIDASYTVRNTSCALIAAAAFR